MIITVLKPVVRNVYITMISIICLLGNSWLCSNAKIKKNNGFSGAWSWEGIHRIAEPKVDIFGAVELFCIAVIMPIWHYAFVSVLWITQRKKNLNVNKKNHLEEERPQNAKQNTTKDIVKSRK